MKQRLKNKEKQKISMKLRAGSLKRQTFDKHIDKHLAGFTKKKEREQN